MPEEQTGSAAPETNTPPCPKCGGEMWDNRENKRNPKAPDFKCKNAGCDGVIWPPRDPNAGPPKATGTADDPACPVCGGKMWDDRLSKRNPRAPDFKCRNKPKVMGGPGCPGVIWPPREGEQRASAPARAGAPAPRGNAPAPRASAPSRPSTPPPPMPAREFSDDEVPEFEQDDDDLPF